MRYPIVQINCVGRQRVPLPIECYRTHIWPNGHENHITYGSVLMGMWSYVNGEQGMLWLEGDIAITPEHLQEIDGIQRITPDHVITVPYLLYTKTTGRQRPMWSVQGISPLGSPIPYEDKDLPPSIPTYFSLGCTYLPSRLLGLVNLKSGNWDYPCLDTRLSELARDSGILCKATPTPCLHLNY